MHGLSGLGGGDRDGCHAQRLWRPWHRRGTDGSWRRVEHDAPGHCVKAASQSQPQPPGEGTPRAGRARGACRRVPHGTDLHDARAALVLSQRCRVHIRCLGCVNKEVTIFSCTTQTAACLRMSKAPLPWRAAVVQIRREIGHACNRAATYRELCTWPPRRGSGRVHYWM